MQSVLTKPAQLLPSLDGVRSLALVGLGKNVGKTTALNVLIQEAAQVGMPLGLTSIGRDGELLDAISSHAKPPVRVPAGTLVATALGALPEGSDGFQVIETTRERTALGPVVIARANREIQWELSGPATSKGLREIREKLWALGAQMVVFDGAFDRRSSATPSLSDATLLVSGAALEPEMQNVLDYTTHMVSLFTNPQADLSDQQRILLEERRLARCAQNGDLEIFQENSLLAEPELVAAKIQSGDRILVGKSLTSRFLDLLTQGAIEVVTNDATQMLISPESRLRFLARGGQLSVRRSILLPLVVCNPYSPYGWRFGADEFLEKMAKCLPGHPVVDLVLGKTLHEN